MLSNGTNSPGHAFTNVFAGTAHYPTVKKKGRHDNFPHKGSVRDQEIVGENFQTGLVRIRFTGKVREGTLSRTADHWFLSAAVEKFVGPKTYAAVQKQLRRESLHGSRQMEAAKVRTGLKPDRSIPKGMRIRGPRTRSRRNAGSLTFERIRCIN